MGAPVYQFDPSLARPVRAIRPRRRRAYASPTRKSEPATRTTPAASVVARACTIASARRLDGLGRHAPADRRHDPRRIEAAAAHARRDDAGDVRDERAEHGLPRLVRHHREHERDRPAERPAARARAPRPRPGCAPRRRRRAARGVRPTTSAEPPRPPRRSRARSGRRPRRPAARPSPPPASRARSGALSRWKAPGMPSARPSHATPRPRNASAVRRLVERRLARDVDDRRARVGARRPRSPPPRRPARARRRAGRRRARCRPSRGDPGDLGVRGTPRGRGRST